MIYDRKSFEEYPYLRSKNADFLLFQKQEKYLSKEAKFITFSHDGILENTIELLGLIIFVFLFMTIQT